VSSVSKRIVVSLALVAVSLLAWALDTRHAGFPYPYHGDEDVKVDQLVDGTQNFLHPILMLQSVRATLALAPLVPVANDDADPRYRQAIAERGRAVSAGFAAASVVLSWLLFRWISKQPSWMALVATTIVAVAPIRVVHAHYLKEDAFFAATSTATLLAFLWFLDRRDRISLLAWGMATGLACASKYFGASFVLVFALAPLVVDVGRRRVFCRDAAWALGIAFAVFVLVDFPAFADPMTFLTGIGHETKHALVGHTLRLFPWTHWMTFHFTHTLVPGFGLGVAAIGLAGMLASLSLERMRASLSSGEQVLLLHAASIYLLLELSPTKPHPAFIRYGLPLLPAFAWFAVRAVVAAASALPGRGRVAIAIALALLVAEPAWDSFRLVDQLESDTRTRAREQIDALEPAVARESYTGLTRDFKFAPEQDLLALRRSGIRYVVLSSLNYDRFELGAQLRWQSPQVYDLAARYRALFTCPYQEIRPTFRTFAFSNPTLRIVDLSGCPQTALAARR